jgi:hypothetical protein
LHLVPKFFEFFGVVRGEEGLVKNSPSLEFSRLEFFGFSSLAKNPLTRDCDAVSLLSELCFLNYLAFFRPAAERAVYILPWVVSRGRSCVFLWAGSII